ncbi:hypothetical protein DHEL01_v203066 [Diaporthe helianthi]|uniref:Uncharacterized protein n=1 Tax=Diaporthe helianthi TaxID=158607 RepID=A0A2P5I7P9_DIAHE|nr:hypothetical protein DHEL01_v203066 [Diaporthe helianthi]
MKIRRLQLSVDDHGFTGIYSRGKSWKQFHTYTEYSNVNQSISDIAWSGFTTNGFVAIPHREAARAGLPAAEDFPDDGEKGVYVLAGFHELHCVMYLREVIQDLMAGKSVDDKAIHINHCYDALRQEIQCRASDYPLYAPYRSKLTGDAWHWGDAPFRDEVVEERLDHTPASRLASLFSERVVKADLMPLISEPGEMAVKKVRMGARSAGRHTTMSPRPHSIMVQNRR